MLPDMKIEFEGKKESKLDQSSLKRHYERLLTWLDLQLITKGLVFIHDIDNNRTKFDTDFQKMAIANTWYNMSKNLLMTNVQKSEKNFDFFFVANVEFYFHFVYLVYNSYAKFQ